MFKKNDKNVLHYEGSPTVEKKGIGAMVEIVPDWYKKTPKFLDNKDPSNNMPAMGLKMCIPFLDAMTTGFYMSLPQEVYVEQTENGPSIRCKHEPMPISNRPPMTTDPMPSPAGHDEEHFIWQTQYAFHLPEGYSAILTHPFNRFELPFMTFTGVVDGDFFMHGGNIPFSIKKGFEGVIPKGTPILQIIPFKREDWVAKKKKGVWRRSMENHPERSYDYQVGWYRKNIWRKKVYKVEG